MKIPKTRIRTKWKADWLIEFCIAFLALGILTREVIFLVVGLVVSLALAYLALAFHQMLTVLRTSLGVSQQLSRTRVFLGDQVEGSLTIKNKSKLKTQLAGLQPAVEEGLRFEFSSPLDRSLLPGTEASSKFTITPSMRGHFKITTYRLTFTDGKDLFAGEVTPDSVGTGSIDVYPGAGIIAPLTPLVLYGGGPETRRKTPAGTDYAGTRQYTLGDDYNRIEWKATARLRTLMVKEFHPETETTLQILIDAGKTMHRRSYVGTRLDEALAVAELLTESVATSRTMVGVWIFDETKLIKAVRPAPATEQIRSLRETSLTLQPEKVSESAAVPLPVARALPPRSSSMPNSERVAAFLRSLRTSLGLAHRKTGAYKAFAEATQAGRRGLLIVLTDLETSAEALLEAVSSHQGRGAKIMVAQIGAAWRLSDDLEQAYAEYQRNDRTLRRLERLGLSVLDLRPEALLEAVAKQIGKTVSTISVRQKD